MSGPFMRTCFKGEVIHDEDKWESDHTNGQMLESSKLNSKMYIVQWPNVGEQQAELQNVYRPVAKCRRTAS